MPPAFTVIGASKKKVIIDTDPGIDDAMAILLAFESPELDIIGITTTFGNVRTQMATYNALHLCDVGGRDDIPVAQGLETSLRGVIKNRIADFVHGNDGLGNTNPAPPKRSAIAQSAPEFLIQKCKELPGEITVVALGPLTNIAKAVEDDPTFTKNVGQIIILGGAFMVNGNVNPAAEANVFGDPEAADIVFTCGADITVIGINITHQVFFTDKEMDEVRDSKGKYASYLYKASRFYFDYHHDFYDIDAIFLHDPTTIVAAIDPSLFTYTSGVVRVQTDGICKGLTVFNTTTKKWAETTAWCNLPPVKVAVTVDAPAVAKILKDRLMGLHHK
ncbi:hypothetical protein R1flu_026791 [Riccia fluitans]|uniref:uridine nucleosidase n=1 Tax=Riccia fluitans TaxID=41844 RepID=A0ABD1XL01_9MARC